MLLILNNTYIIFKVHLWIKRVILRPSWCLVCVCVCVCGCWPAVRWPGWLWSRMRCWLRVVKGPGLWTAWRRTVWVPAEAFPPPPQHSSSRTTDSHLASANQNPAISHTHRGMAQSKAQREGAMLFHRRDRECGPVCVWDEGVFTFRSSVCVPRLLVQSSMTE